MRKPIVVFTSVGSEQQALTIAEELVQQELVAAVNVLPTMRSIYRFKGRVFDDEENLLVIKTTANLFEEVSTVILQMHTYEVPEIISVKVENCSDDVLKWILQNTKKSKAVKDN